MELRRMVLITGGVALTVLLVFVAYRWVDCGVSLDYAREEQQHQRARIELLRSVLRGATGVTGFTRADLLEAVRGRGARERVVKEYSDRIEVDDLVFRMHDNRVTDVVFLDEVDPGKR